MRVSPEQLKTSLDQAITKVSNNIPPHVDENPSTITDQVKHLIALKTVLERSKNVLVETGTAKERQMVNEAISTIITHSLDFKQQRDNTPAFKRLSQFVAEAQLASNAFKRRAYILTGVSLAFSFFQTVLNFFVLYRFSCRDYYSMTVSFSVFLLAASALLVFLDVALLIGPIKKTMMANGAPALLNPLAYSHKNALLSDMKHLMSRFGQKEILKNCTNANQIEPLDKLQKLALKFVFFVMVPLIASFPFLISSVFLPVLSSISEACCRTFFLRFAAPAYFFLFFVGFFDAFVGLKVQSELKRQSLRSDDPKGVYLESNVFPSRLAYKNVGGVFSIAYIKMGNCKKAEVSERTHLLEMGSDPQRKKTYNF